MNDQAERGRRTRSAHRARRLESEACSTWPSAARRRAGGRGRSLRGASRSWRTATRRCASRVASCIRPRQARHRRLGTAGAAAVGGAGSPSGPGGGAWPVVRPLPEQTAYNQAFDALKASNYAAAISGLRVVPQATYPNSPIAENAQYWLGEAHYAKGEYDKAATVVPRRRRALAELAQVARCAAEARLLADRAEAVTRRGACDAEPMSLRKYPDSDAAKLAAERLRRMPADAR